MRTNTATLIDGRVVSTWSEEWRIECLARSIARKPHLHLRRQAMMHWQKKMPEDAFKSFKILVSEIYNLDRNRVAK